MSSNDGGPAFPRPISRDDRGGFAHAQLGMSLRDYFAAAALQGLLTNPDQSVACCLPRGRATQARALSRRPTLETDILNQVCLAWDYADAMLAQREYEVLV